MFVSLDAHPTVDAISRSHRSSSDAVLGACFSSLSPLRSNPLSFVSHVLCSFLFAYAHLRLVAFYSSVETEQAYAPQLRSLLLQCSEASRRMRELREAIARERAALPSARRLVLAAKVQSERLLEVERGLPSYLPGSNGADPSAEKAGTAPPAPAEGRPCAPLADVSNVARVLQGRCAAGKAKAPGGVAASRPAGGRPGTSGRRDGENGEVGRGAASTSTSAPSGADAAPLAPSQAPRRFVSESDFAAVPSYLKGRLTRDAVNAAIEELAARADDVSRVIGGDRASERASHLHSTSNTAAAGWQLLRRQHTEALRGQYWVPESHLRLKSPMEPGRQGRNMAGVLRHLGRCTELRVKRAQNAVGGAAGARQEIVYILTAAE